MKLHHAIFMFFQKKCPPPLPRTNAPPGRYTHVLSLKMKWDHTDTLNNTVPLHFH
jgi:hypothetical protein